jgi:hypothetical protein
MMFPLVLELAADRIPIAVTCRVLKFSKQAFFKWRADPVSQRDWDNAHLMNAAVDLHRDDPAFGYRFISDEIEAASGLPASERRVWRLCSDQRLWSVFSKKRGLNRKAGPPVHDDLVLRDFTAAKLNQLWLVDITEHWTAWIQGISATPLALRGRSNVASSTIEETEPTVHTGGEGSLFPPVGSRGNHSGCGSRTRAQR